MKALVTVAIGERCLANWRRYCESGWRTYAQRHGLDLLVMGERIDVTDSRHPAWQKCLMLDSLPQYDQIAILDSDIAINPAAPNIFAGVPLDRVGGVISGGHIHPDLRDMLLSRMETINGWPHTHPTFLDFQRHAYASSGLNQTFDELLNTGVMVASPQQHRAMFDAAYRSKISASPCHEQIPLSHAILNAGVFQPINSRFNSVLYETLVVHHPYVLAKALGEDVTRAVVQSEFANNFFLHFAYGQQAIMRLLASPDPCRPTGRSC